MLFRRADDAGRSGFRGNIEGMIENDRSSAEAAVSDTGAQFTEMFAADDSYMRARAADIRDISTQVIGILTGEGRKRHVRCAVYRGSR